MTEDLFHVWQFFPDETYERVAGFVGAEEAVKTAHSYTVRPAAVLGVIRKVMITDMDDFCVFQWEFGQGVVYPPPAQERAPECDHEWVYTGTAYGGDDDSHHGEGRCYCAKCGADGDG